MRLPRVGQRVWTDVISGTFTVVKVNAQQGVADIELTTGVQSVHMHVPFSTMHPVGEDVSQAERIVNEITED